jgi:hypothetical protein
MILFNIQKSRYWDNTCAKSRVCVRDKYRTLALAMAWIRDCSKAKAWARIRIK